MAMTTVTFVGVDVGDWRDVTVRTGDRSLLLSYNEGDVAELVVPLQRALPTPIVPVGSATSTASAPAGWPWLS